jgi:hypothetical protein
MSPMARAWLFAAAVAMVGALLIGCASERAARDWADVSHATGCVMGGLC